MKPYAKRSYAGWSHYGRRAIKRLKRLGLWDDLDAAELNKKAARREGKKEIRERLDELNY